LLEERLTYYGYSRQVKIKDAKDTSEIVKKFFYKKQGLEGRTNTKRRGVGKSWNRSQTKTGKNNKKGKVYMTNSNTGDNLKRSNPTALRVGESTE